MNNKTEETYESIFARHYNTWVIAFITDLNMFFTTTQRGFLWECKESFETEEEASTYFYANFQKFKNWHDKMAEECRGLINYNFYFQSSKGCKYFDILSTEERL